MNEDQELDQYEAVMTRLEEIVKLLETGRAPLGESLRLYQEARSLSESANRLLSRAEAVINEVRSGDENPRSQTR